MSAATDRAAANHHERRAITAEQTVHAVALIHFQDRKRCAECDQPWPCRTTRLVAS